MTDFKASVSAVGRFGAEHLQRLWGAVLRHPVRAALVPLAFALLFVLALVPFTPSVSDLRKAKIEVPAALMSADGVVLAQFKRVNRQWVSLGKISPHVVNALIATEDHRLRQHHGIDIRRTGAALIYTLTGKRQGGSTITQQLARSEERRVGKDRRSVDLGGRRII